MPSDPVIQPSQNPMPGSAVGTSSASPTGGALPSAATLSGHATSASVNDLPGGPSSGGTGMEDASRRSPGDGQRGAWRTRSAGAARTGDGVRRASSAMPSITTMIRADHSHVLANFHRFRPNLSSLRQQAIADAICLALEVHAQLEEEIFYPALQEVAGDDPVLKDARPEHDEMRRLIAELRGCEPGEPRFRETLNQLMRDVMHHVADEEAVLLPLAETRLADRLGELGARMTKRRLSLVAPHTFEMAKNQALATPVMTLAALGAVAGGAWLLASSLGSSSRR